MHLYTLLDTYIYTGEYVDFFVEVQRWRGNMTNTEPDKCSELKFFPLNSIPNNTVDYVRYVCLRVCMYVCMYGNVNKMIRVLSRRICHVIRLT